MLHHDKAVIGPQPSFLPKVVSAFHSNQGIVLPSFCPKPQTLQDKALYPLDVVSGVRDSPSDSLFVFFETQVRVTKLLSLQFLI